MTDVGFELIAIILLVLANGALAMSEIALVTARRSKLRDWAQKGAATAKPALDLASQPNQFLSTVQIGSTLVGIVAGALGGRRLADETARFLNAIPVLTDYSDAIALAAVVICITYLSVVIGDLVPKQIALNHPERIAVLTAIPMRMIATLSTPMVRFLTASTGVLLRLTGNQPRQEPSVTEEKVRTLIRQGTAAGVFETSEREMMEAVIGLGDKSARGMMTPRTRIMWFDVRDSAETIRTKMSQSGHSRFPICSGSLDNVVGVVETKDLLASALAGKTLELRASLQQPAFVPRSMTALQVLDHIKRSGSHLVFVVDEYGGIEGLLTHHDILEAIAGDMPLGKGPVESKAVQRRDGSWLLDGMLAVDEFKGIFNLESLPGERKDAYQTLGGFLFTQMGRVPSTTDLYIWNNLRFEIVDMDGKRIDKVLVTCADESPNPPGTMTRSQDEPEFEFAYRERSKE